MNKMTANIFQLITDFVWWQKECLLSLDQASSESALFNGTYLGRSKNVIFQFPFKFFLISVGICFLLC